MRDIPTIPPLIDDCKNLSLEIRSLNQSYNSRKDNITEKNINSVLTNLSNAHIKSTELRILLEETEKTILSTKFTSSKYYKPFLNIKSKCIETADAAETNYADFYSKTHTDNQDEDDSQK